MASHGKVLDLFDDRYLELQDVVGNVEPLPTLVPYEQYKQHAITYRMDTNHDIFMALLQDFTERKALETGKELWTWCVQWEVDETATRRAVAAPHSPKEPRLDSGLRNIPPAQDTPSMHKSQGNAPPITAHARCIDPELLQQEDMLRILVDIVQVDSTVVPNFIEFLYRWIDFYEGDGKALKAALHGEIPSLWDFEYHPLLVPDEVKKKMDQANGVSRDGKEERMRQKPDLAALERKVEESERLKYREVHYGIQPPKLNEPLPPLINIPRDRYKRAKYYDACFKSRQRAFFLLVEAGVTAQNMRDYNRCQTMSLHDTPLLVEADGLRNYEKDAKLAQFFTSLKEAHGAKQLEIAISNKLADEAQFVRGTAPQGSSGGPLILATTSHAHRPEFSDQILHKIQQTKDEGQQRINVVPTPLAGKMRSTLFQGARDKAGLQEMLARSSFLPPPRPSANINGGATTDSDDDAAFRGGMRMLPRPSLPPPATLPRPSLPPLATLPRSSLPPPTLLHHPNLPPLTRPPPTMTSSQPQDVLTHNNSLFPQQPRPLGSFTPPGARAASSREPTPPRIAAFMRDVTPNQANQLIAILKQQADLAAGRVRVQQLAQTGQENMQNPQSIGDNTGFNAPYMVQRASNPPMGLDLPLPLRTPVLGTSRAPNITVSAPHLPPQHQLPRGFEGAFNPHVRPPLPPESEHQRSFPPDHPPTSFQATHQLNMYQQAHTSPWPTALGRHDHTPPPAFAQRLAAAQETQGHVTSYGLRNAGPSLPLAPGLPSLNRQFDQTRSTQERQQSSLNFLLAPSRTMMQRTAPSPLTLRPPASPLTSLATSLLATSPFATSHRGIPVQIYLPRILVPSNTIGPGGLKLGNNGCAETDAFLLGHTHPKSGKITLNRAIFLPLGVWTNAQDRVRKGRYTVLESYTAPNKAPSVPHRAVYEKAKQAYEMMILSSPAARERELTKRWRASRGRMTATERGAVWEGWAVEIDREIAMSREERRGAFVQNELVDGIDENSQEVRRRKEIEELLETDEAWDYEEEEDEEKDDEDDGGDEDVRMHG